MSIIERARDAPYNSTTRAHIKQLKGDMASPAGILSVLVMGTILAEITLARMTKTQKVAHKTGYKRSFCKGYPKIFQ